MMISTLLTEPKRSTPLPPVARPVRAIDDDPDDLPEPPAESEILADEDELDEIEVEEFDDEFDDDFEEDDSDDVAFDETAEPAENLDDVDDEEEVTGDFDEDEDF